MFTHTRISSIPTTIFFQYFIHALCDYNYYAAVVFFAMPRSFLSFLLFFLLSLYRERTRWKKSERIVLQIIEKFTDSIRCSRERIFLLAFMQRSTYTSLISSAQRQWCSVSRKIRCAFERICTALLNCCCYLPSFFPASNIIPWECRFTRL